MTLQVTFIRGADVTTNATPALRSSRTAAPAIAPKHWTECQKELQMAWSLFAFWVPELFEKASQHSTAAESTMVLRSHMPRVGPLCPTADYDYLAFLHASVRYVFTSPCTV